MENPAPPGLNNDQDAATNQSSLEPRQHGIQRLIQSLVHAGQCRSSSCSLPSCQKIKCVIQHAKGCKRKTNGSCPVCRQLIALCCYHSKHCQERVCSVPFCLNIKQKLRQQQLEHQHRLQQLQHQHQHRLQQLQHQHQHQLQQLQHQHRQQQLQHQHRLQQLQLQHQDQLQQLQNQHPL